MVSYKVCSFTMATKDDRILVIALLLRCHWQEIRTLAKNVPMLFELKGLVIKKL